jgi:bifunctional enzyme CysN/CysC
MIWCRARYWLKIGPQTVSATVAQPKYQINVNTMEHLAAKTLDLNAIGVATVTTDRDIPFALCRKPRSGRVHPD